MKIYCDTSFLHSFYIADANSQKAIRVVQSIGDLSIPFTVFHRLELRNGIRRALFGGFIREQSRKDAFRDIESDLNDGTLSHTDLDWPQVYRHAQILSSDYTEKVGLRTLDILHVASALSIQADHFFTFDVRQHQFAIKAGLKTKF